MAGRLCLIAAFAALLATTAAANDRACTREALGRPPALTALQLTVEQLFAPSDDLPLEGTDGVTAQLPIMEMVMVRVKDGKPVLACVDTKEAAQRFLTAPTAKLGTTRTAEEK